MNDIFQTLQTFDLGGGRSAHFHSLPALEKAGVGPVSKLPRSIRVVLESVLRNCDGKKVAEKDVRTLANWNAKKPANEEIPLSSRASSCRTSRACRSWSIWRPCAQRWRGWAKPGVIEPLVPVDLVVDHSVQVDFAGSAEALRLNMDMEFTRNRERYEFLKWGQQAFKTFGVVPPGIGIVHQVNLEYLARGVLHAPQAQGGGEVYYPDSLVGTDSHTTMINGLGIVGWGVGGIEAEAGMLGQPVYFLTPEVVGVHLTGSLREGVTATDLALQITQMLRAAKVVGKFVEFYGEGASSLPLTDRATVANMAPEYGATMGYFPVDAESVNYLRATGRSDDECAAFENYFKAQAMFGMPGKGDIEYSVDLALDLGTVQPSVAGPKRPQDRLNLPDLGEAFRQFITKPPAEGGYGKPADALGQRYPIHLNGHSKPTQKEVAPASNAAPTDKGTAMTADGGKQIGETFGHTEMVTNRPTATPATLLAEADEPEFQGGDSEVGHGSVLIAAITSCTNTSNPSVMLGAGLLAKKAVERGLRVNPAVKTSLAPGSRVVTDYLAKSGLQPYLDQLGFQIVGYGCTTCIGNSGPLHPEIEKAIGEHDLVAASVLSGNRNFEARVHQNIKANFLMSAAARRGVRSRRARRFGLEQRRAGQGQGRPGRFPERPLAEPAGNPRHHAGGAEARDFPQLNGNFAAQNPKWNEIPGTTGAAYAFDAKSTYIQEPPFFTDFGMQPGTITELKGMRPLGIFGDSVTTDHISPAGAIKASSPAGKFLQENGVEPKDFNSYGSRRGNDKVMTRGTFANVRIKNLMVPGVEGGVTKHQPDGEQMPIYDASVKYQADSVPLIIFAGQEYGTGSSRDWAAKGTRLLGVKAVVAQSFERIHRSNLVGMGVLPLQFPDGVSAQTLKLDGSETFDLVGLDETAKPGDTITLVIHRADGKEEKVALRSRIDTAIEVDYYRHGGILPFVLRELVAGAN